MVTDYKNNIIETSPEDEDLLLPEGYGADDDIFADPQNWTGKQTDEPASGDKDEESKDDGAEDAPTTEQETAQDVPGSETAEAPTTEPTAPTKAQEASTAPNMLKFRAKYNSQEQDVELNESELPGIWQKAQNHDKMQSRYNEQQQLFNKFQQIAKRLGYSDAKEMAEKAEGAFQEAEVKNLMDKEGVSERVAKAIVAQEMQNREGTAPTAQPQETPKRDTQAEVNELLIAKPQLRGQQLPPEVIAEWGGGKNLLLAYTEYENRKAAAEAARLQQENNIHKQNAANAAKAPVRGVASGGATNTKGDDDFLKGFNSDD